MLGFSQAAFAGFSTGVADTVQVGTRLIEAPFLHAVEPDGTLSEIARRYDLSVGQLQAFNGMSNPQLEPGMVLVVGRAPESWDVFHTVVEGETLDDIASTFGMTGLQLRILNSLSTERLAPGQQLMVPRVLDDAVPLPTPPPVAADTTTADTAATDTVAVSTDSTASTLPAISDSLVAADSLVATDSTGVPDSAAVAEALPDTGLAAKYIPRFGRDTYTARLAPRQQRPLQARIGSYWRHEIELDSTGQRYVAREIVAGNDVRYPLILSPAAYQEMRLEDYLDTSFRALAEQRALRQQQRRRQGFGVNLVVPGGRQSAFTTIFGKPEVDLRVNGQANIDAGFAYQKSDQQVSLTGRKGRLDPDFGQNIRLSITGSIGDKMQVDVNWDTERTFDFQNQLKLEYTGYEDEIVQSVVAGNVFLQTPSQLIQGGQSLFGIRSDFQLGGVRLTTVASQQEGESQELALEGGSEPNPFDLKPTDYEDNTHFFMGYFFRNQWEPAYNTDPSRPPAVSNNKLANIEVWRYEISSTGQNDPDVRAGVGLVDLGEAPFFTVRPDTNVLDLPSTSIDRYTDNDLDRLRQEDQIVGFLTGEKGLREADFQTGFWRKMREGVDYDVDLFLGYISLRSSLRDEEALAVAYRYQPTVGAPLEKIGDFAEETNTSSRLVLKLLRKANYNPTGSTWPLTMRNIYKIPGRGFSPEEFELDVVYERPGTPPQKRLPGSDSQQTLLQLLGLDRLTEDGSPQPDNQIDFQQWLIQSQTGRLIFPYLEPFGSRIASVTDNDALIFTNLYSQKKVEAIRDSQHDVYRIQGESKSTVQEVYNLGGFGIVEGSVRVTSGGVELSEGADYIVDYSTGTVTITNTAFLQAGRDLRITHEQNAFAAIQKKTLVGMRADYTFLDKLALGATMLRLSEKPLIDKFRIGEEPLRNTIWGVDGSLDLEPRWLTRAIDALPLIQTRAPSTISFKGEFAQLLPGSPQTLAFRRTRDQLRDDGLDFKDDELEGISYIDDFESVENTITLKQPGLWRLSSVPDTTLSPTGGTAGYLTDTTGTSFRGDMGWYILPLSSSGQFASIFEQQLRTNNANAIRSTHVNEVFPNKDISALSAAERRLQTFDVFFDPTGRGPYNYTRDFTRFSDPFARKNTWGGMMQRLPEGYTDFSVNNIEFIEFIFSPYSRAPGEDAGPDAVLYVDIGSISEDVFPNERLNREDGLSLSAIDRDPTDTDGQSRINPNGILDSIVKVDEETGRTEDLGLDGWPSNPNTGGLSVPYEVSEQSVFQSFINNARTQLGESSPFYRRIEVDPSGDDYHHFLDSYWDTFYPDGPLLQQRYTRFFTGPEVNTFEAQQQIIGNTSPVTGNSNIPDTEDLNNNGNLDTDDSYYRYAVPLSKQLLDQLADPNRTDDYVISKVEGIDPQSGAQSTWYKIRIPVRDDQRQRVGQIQDFALIRTMRVWTTGHTDPITMRFATFELVGSQWQKSRQVGCPLFSDAECQARDVGDLISISTINNEESPSYAIPSGAIRSKLRLATGVQDAREQSLVLRAENVRPEDERAIFKTFNQPLDLLKYGNVRMFIHGHGEGFDERGDVRFFMRFGLNETNDYYEYEQPITPSDPLAVDENEIWQTNVDVGGTTTDLNSVFIKLSEFNKLKVARDDSLGFSPEREFIRGGFDFAPPGTNLKIRGNPSLSGITTIVMGIRGDTLRNKVVSESEIWLNELRVTEFDSESGWAAVATAQIRLADLASLNANIRTQTDGFGPLSSELGDRQSNNQFNWSLTSTLNLHKFIPERFGWNIPVSYSIRDNQSTPRFSQERGDIRLEELLERVEENPNLTAAERQEERQEILDANQTNQSTRSFSVPVSKSGSRSRLLRNTVDALAVNYSRSNSESSNPSTAFNDSWQWSSSVTYRLQSRTPRTFRPLWFLEGAPVLGFVGNLRMSYLPQSLNLSASANRNFSEQQERSRIDIREEDPLADSLQFETLSRFPVRENHSFVHGRTFQLAYNPFTFLTMGYNNTVSQNLRTMSVDTLFSVAYLDSASLQLQTFDNLTLAEAIDRGLVPPDQGLEVARLNPLPIGDVVTRLLNGTGNVRTDQYGESYNATFQPRFNRIQALKWMTIQPVAYTGRFQWRNGPAGQRNTGAGVTNNATVRSGLRLGLQEFWRQFDFYQSLEAKQRDAVNQKRIRRARKTQERQQRKETRQRRRDERRKIDAQIDSLRNLGYVERDTLIARLGEAQRDSLQERLQAAAVSQLDSITTVIDSLESERDPMLDSLSTAHQLELDSLRLDFDGILEELRTTQTTELDSIRNMEGTVIDSTLTLEGAVLDSILTAKSAEFDSLLSLRQQNLDSLYAQRETDLEDLRASTEERVEREIEEAEVERDRLDRLRRARLPDLVDAENAFAASADSLAAIADSLAEARAGGNQPNTPPPNADAEESSGALSFLNPSGLLRRIALAVTGIRDLSFTYSGSWTGSSSNVKDPDYNVISAFQGDAPSLAYRLGLQRTIDANIRRRFLEDSTLRVGDRLANNTSLGAKTNLQLSQSFRVDVTWDAKWDEQQQLEYDFFGGEVVRQQTENGSNQSTVWSFGSSYDDFFKSQLQTFLDDRAAAPGENIGDENGDGEIALTNPSLVGDFQSTFINSFGKIGPNNFVPFPLPNWNINYTGLGSLPILRRLAQSATLRHGYAATYDSNFESNADAGLEQSRQIRTLRGDGTGVTAQNILYTQPDLSVGSVRVNQRFQPLLSVDITWKGSLQTGISWSTSKAFALSATSADVTTSETGQLSLRTSWSKRGLRLPLPGIRRRQLNNVLRFSLTAERAENVELRYRLLKDIETYLTDPAAIGLSVDEYRDSLPPEDEFLNPPPVSSIRLSLEPRISYTFSNRVSADFFVRYENLQSEGSRVPTTTTVKGGFNVRVSIAN